jgi:glycosyltransferase involved in cell wall biosynthesis
VGVECVALPPVIDPARVRVERPDGGRFVTFVNPEPGKGVFVFARIAEALGRTRPDIPFLVVEGRGRTDWLSKTGIDWTGITTIHRMANTPDPRQFYRQSRLVLMPSVAPESFGLVAAEAIMNGIPVIASDRGALPEVVGGDGVCLPIPAHITPETRTPPTAEEVQPWVTAIPEWCRRSVSPASPPWLPDVAVSRWEEFLGRLSR